jgi:hypothetical protein
MANAAALAALIDKTSRDAVSITPRMTLITQSL